MSWTPRVISLVTLVVFAVMPVSGALCAVACDPAAPPASVHHGPGSSCEDAARPSTGPQVADISEPNCGNHQAGARFGAAAAAGRADRVAAASPLTGSAVHAPVDALPTGRLHAVFNTPPRPAPTTTTPSVLRV